MGLGREVFRVSTRQRPAIDIVRASSAFGRTPFEARAVKLKLPFAVGVPDRTPPDESVRPVGSMPVATEVVGVGSPPTVNVNGP